MHDTASIHSQRRPRFRRAETPVPFRLTDDDIEMVRQIARHRFVRSDHVAALVGRSRDRANDRLCHLYHAGYIDRPRAQLDYYPSSGSIPMVYALADRGADLLRDRNESGINGWSRKNREVGRPFIEHQLEIVDFLISLRRAARNRRDVRLIPPEEIVAAFPEKTRKLRNPMSMHVTLSHQGTSHEIGIVPDLVFGLGFPDGSRRCFMVEIDRGTMPVSRTDITQTSFERKMRAYLTAFAEKRHERVFNWKAFRVLTVTTDRDRMNSMTQALSRIQTRPAPNLFLFAVRDELHDVDAIRCAWMSADGRAVGLA